MRGDARSNSAIAEARITPEAYTDENSEVRGGIEAHPGLHETRERRILQGEHEPDARQPRLVDLAAWNVIRPLGPILVARFVLLLLLRIGNDERLDRFGESFLAARERDVERLSRRSPAG